MGGMLTSPRKGDSDVPGIREIAATGLAMSGRSATEAADATDANPAIVARLRQMSPSLLTGSDTLAGDTAGTKKQLGG